MSAKKDLWVRWRVAIEFKERLLGNLPVEEQALQYAAQRVGEELARPPEEVLAEMKEDTELAAEEVEAPAGRVAIALPRDEKGIYIRGNRHIRGLLKEAARMLGLRIAEVIKHGVFVDGEDGDKIYIKRGGEYIREPDGQLVYTARFMTARGPRSAIKVVEYVESKPDKPLTAEFEIRIVKAQWGKRKLDEETWRAMWELAGEIGLLGARQLGEGQFIVKKLERIKD